MVIVSIFLCDHCEHVLVVCNNGFLLVEFQFQLTQTCTVKYWLDCCLYIYILFKVDLEETTSNDQGEVSLKSYLEKVKLLL